MFCGAFDEWTCRYMAFAGETPPPVTYHARFDHEGPPVKSGDIIDDAAYERTGIVRGIAVHVEEKDDAAGLAKASQWSALLTEWGCAPKDEYGKTKVFATTLGHNNETVADARYLDFVARGLLWAVGKLDETHLKPAAKVLLADPQK